MKEILQADGLKRVEDLYSRIGFGKAPVKSVVRRLAGTEALEREKEKEEPGRLRKAVGKLLSIDGAAIRVRGEGDLLATIAQCCTPVPGEPIVGFVTRGRGISVHSEDCANVRNLLYHPEREIDVEWAAASDVVYPVVLRIETEDQPGVLARLTEVIAKHEANIKNLDASSSGAGRAAIEVVVEVRDQRQLARLRETIEALPHVIQVVRQRGARGKDRRAGSSASTRSS
jgi:GTP pyrophosphokinase